MAIITEEPDPPSSPLRRRHKPINSQPPPTTTTGPDATTRSTVNATQNPFHFWLYFTVAVSIVTLIFVAFSSLLPQDLKAWFLGLPADLRQHRSNGRTIKIQTSPDQPQLEVFAIQAGPVKSDHVFIVHGLGCSSFAFRGVVGSLGNKGVHAVAIDLPGSGFSDKSIVTMGEGQSGVLGRFWEIYGDIKEKGLFWGFDQLVEKGYVNYEERRGEVSKREIVKAIELGPEEMGRVLAQVIDSMGLAPVDLVLHDSALVLCANWVSENPRLVRSVTLLDGAQKGAALPFWVLELPVIRELVLGVRSLFGKVIEMCCSRSITVSDVDAHRILLKGAGGREAVVGMGRKLNNSFDLAGWSGLDGLRKLPMQVIWSSGWSKEWSVEGSRVATALPDAKFVSHSGGRWPQEEAADEIAESIHQFISSLPKPTKQSEEQPVPEHVQKMFDEAESSSQHNHLHHFHGDHVHHDAHPAGHGMNTYGLGHGWET